MATVIRRETRKRGFFGWLFLLIFLGFNALMLIWLIAYWSSVGNLVDAAASDAERAGSAIGGAIGTSMLLFFWVCGAVITGLLAFLTRGHKTIVEETVR